MPLPRMSYAYPLSSRGYSLLRKLPPKWLILKTGVYNTIDDNLLKRLLGKFAANPHCDDYMRVSLLLIFEITRMAHSRARFVEGYVCTYQQLADDCDVTTALVQHCVETLLDMAVIQCKWRGSSFTNVGSCYLLDPLYLM